MFIVIELQTTAAGVVGSLVYKYDNLNEAEAKYHSILAAAAVSTMAVHACVIMTNTGTVVKSEFYRHDQEEPIEE